MQSTDEKPFGFEPGSYGGPRGYMPALACFSESASGEKTCRFVLANQTCVVKSEREAVARATTDFGEACRIADATAPTAAMAAMARLLSARGYVFVSQHKIV